MKFKQRALTAPDLGKDDQPVYTFGLGSTGVGYIYPGDPRLVKDGPLHRAYHSLPDNMLLPVPAYAGKEVFGSTSRKRPVYNDCVHHVNSWRCYLYGYVHKYCLPSTQQNYYQWVCRNRMQDTVKVGVPDASIGIPPIDMLFKNRAWASMQPRFDGEVSLVNSLFELKDFKDIAKGLFKIANGDTLFQLAKLGKELLKQKPGLTAAQGVLAYNFAIRPLVADIAAIILNAKSTAEAAYTKFVQAGTERGASHYSEYIKNDLTLDLPGYRSPDRRGSISRVKFTATLERTYNVCPRSASEIYSQYWGLSWSPEAIWNALPFSFLVDYFFAIGQSLKFATQQKGVDLNAIQYCESIQAVNQSGAFIVARGPMPYWDHNGFVQLKTDEIRHVTGYSSTFFRRYVTKPSMGVVVPRIKYPTGTQMLNIAALLRTMF